MNKIKKLVCMLLVVCFSVAAFPFTFASASSDQIAIQEASTGRYLTAKNTVGANLTFENGAYWFETCNPNNGGEFTLKLIESDYKVAAFDIPLLDDGLETDTTKSVDFKLESTGDGTYYLKAYAAEKFTSPTQSSANYRWCYVQSFDDGDIDLTDNKDEAVKVNVRYSNCNNVTGTVSTDNNILIEGVKVSAYSKDGEPISLSDGEPISLSYTDSDGTYSLYLPTGDYTIKVEAEGANTVSRSVSITNNSEYNFNLEYISTCIPAGTIVKSVKVVDNHGDPIEGAKVMIYRTEYTPFALTGGYTNSEGIYTCPVDIPCDTIEVEKSGYQQVDTRIYGNSKVAVTMV